MEIQQIKNIFNTPINKKSKAKKVSSKSKTGEDNKSKSKSILDSLHNLALKNIVHISYNSEVNIKFLDGNNFQISKKRPKNNASGNKISDDKFIPDEPKTHKGLIYHIIDNFADINKINLYINKENDDITAIKLTAIPDKIYEFSLDDGESLHHLYQFSLSDRTNRKENLLEILKTQLSQYDDDKIRGFKVIGMEKAILEPEV